MLFFGLTLAAGVVAVLAAEKLDIEGLNPPARKRVPHQAKLDSRAPASAGFVPGGVFLRQQ
jgi:hypothetical protein